ncbi:hypothetical protein Goari_022266 [Gossypium aridum]|uniref:Uncharacterized protein n=1 Tax=Gossypium aridum TaxID=34290 RepID=A0A7J8YP83_GOSAI|nr:hypothetical protein [Gossypium aridum]
MQIQILFLLKHFQMSNAFPLKEVKCMSTNEMKKVHNDITTSLMAAR